LKLSSLYSIFDDCNPIQKIPKIIKVLLSIFKYSIDEYDSSNILATPKAIKKKIINFGKTKLFLFALNL
jgi:hypothetical protein